MGREPLDLTGLRALRVDPESDRIALTAATIVGYAIMPSRDRIGALIDDALADIAGAAGDRRRVATARERLVDRLWHHFQHGESRDTA